MDSTIPRSLEWVLAVLVWGGAPIVAVLISVLYFLQSKADSSMLRRIVTSAHGAAVAALYALAMFIAIQRWEDPALGKPFALALLGIVGLIVISLLLYRGSKKLHWLQILNIASLAWTGFMGGMAVTGKWL